MNEVLENPKKNRFSLNAWLKRIEVYESEGRGSLPFLPEQLTDTAKVQIDILDEALKFDKAEKVKP